MSACNELPGGSGSNVYRTSSLSLLSRSTSKPGSVEAPLTKLRWASPDSLKNKGVSAWALSRTGEAKGKRKFLQQIVHSYSPICENGCYWHSKNVKAKHKQGNEKPCQKALPSINLFKNQNSPSKKEKRPLQKSKIETLLGKLREDISFWRILCLTQLQVRLDRCCAAEVHISSSYFRVITSGPNK